MSVYRQKKWCMSKVSCKSFYYLIKNALSSKRANICGAILEGHGIRCLVAYMRTVYSTVLEASVQIQRGEGIQPNWIQPLYVCNSAAPYRQLVGRKGR